MATTGIHKFSQVAFYTPPSTILTSFFPPTNLRLPQRLTINECGNMRHMLPTYNAGVALSIVLPARRSCSKLVAMAMTMTAAAVRLCINYA
ncbi:unnamed protein product, partial [Ceratitis capitata]